MKVILDGTNLSMAVSNSEKNASHSCSTCVLSVVLAILKIRSGHVIKFHRSDPQKLEFHVGVIFHIYTSFYYSSIDSLLCILLHVYELS